MNAWKKPHTEYRLLWREKPQDSTERNKQRCGMDLRKPLYDIEKEAKPATVCVTGAFLIASCTYHWHILSYDGVQPLFTLLQAGQATSLGECLNCIPATFVVPR